MASMADYRPKAPPYNASLPHRKPVGVHGVQPLTQIHRPEPAQRGGGPPIPTVALPGGVIAAGHVSHSPTLADTMHSRGDRTSSSNTMQSSPSATSIPGPPGQASLARQSTSNSLLGNSSLRRSTSNRTTASQNPTSYVALMRKQKGTVWCDRAQHEDPRLLAAQRAARQRAAMEIAGGTHSISRSTGGGGGMVGGVRSKIRHGGAAKAQVYNPGLTPGTGGVPMRLSATEIDEGDSDEEDVRNNSFVARSAAAPPAPPSGGPQHHQRTGSGRSSLGSGGKRIGSYGGGGANRLSHTNVSTPSSSGQLSPQNHDADETPMPGGATSKRTDYFSPTTTGATANTTGLSGGGSGSSGERENSFGAPGQMPTRVMPEIKRKTSDELRRRGSVDDRTTTMSGVRLFVANPDLSD